MRPVLNPAAGGLQRGVIVIAVRVTVRVESVNQPLLRAAMGPCAEVRFIFVQQDEGRRHYASAEEQRRS